VASLYTDWAIQTPEQLDILYIFPENKNAYFKICSVDENYAPLGYYAASSGNFLPTTQLLTPTHAQLQRHRLKFTKTHLKNSYMFRSTTILRVTQYPR